MFIPTRNSGYEHIGNPDKQDLQNENQEIVCQIYGYSTHRGKTWLFILISIMFFGIPYIFLTCSTKLKLVKLRKSPLDISSFILVRNAHGLNSLIDVKTEDITLPQLGPRRIRYFLYQHTKYVWDEHKEIFVPLRVFVPKAQIDDYLNDLNGLNKDEYNSMVKLYGENQIQVEVKSYWNLFIHEVFNLFYMFQAFSVILWCIDDYMIYAGCVFILTLFSSITSLIETRKQSEALRDLVESSQCHQVNVMRKDSSLKNVILEIDPADLIPGDLIVLPPGNFIMPCDAILLTGHCIVNESVLTGESVPVMKTAPYSSTEVYSITDHKRHTLFAGTTLIQTRYYGDEHVLARVVHTGFDTTKGALVKSILFPTPINLQFYKDSFKFVIFLFVVATTGMAYCLYLYTHRGAELKEVIVRTLDIITIVVPPALPAAMTVGTIYSQNRLKKIGIFCISPPRINVCGKTKLACFDKTGTLTHDGLDMKFVVPCIGGIFCNPVTDVCKMEIRSKFLQGMATCHSLTRIEGTLNGDPLDLNMFEFTKWELEEPGDENERFDILAPTVVYPAKRCDLKILNSGNTTDISYQIGIIRQFPFSSTLQCMSVICQNLESSHMVAFVKGAPEKVQGMCLSYTLPSDFSEKLSEFTNKGYRVIAIAYKDLPNTFKWREAQKTKRIMIESDLIFLGLLVMQNSLKKETTPVIQTLHRANIRTVMITGDNILTAISVARDCTMVNPYDDIFLLNVENTEDSDEIPKFIIEKAGVLRDSSAIFLDMDYKHFNFALDGKTWNKLKTYYSDMLPSILVRSKIFARFQPDQKTQLISEFQKLDYIVSMVGDGANDCGALKAAHVGVSLSQAEASVAAPFTSRIPDISCLVHLILEGRCALVTSFATFKYMALYSLIQFFTILILYKHHSILGDYQFLFIDLVITTSLAVTMGRQGPSIKLGTKQPMRSLVSLKNLIPLALQISMCAIFQLASLWYLYQQKWFKPIPNNTIDEIVVSWENTVLFTVSCYQYVILAVVFSKGAPYRRTLFKNLWFMVSVLSLLAFITWIMVYPNKYLAKIMDIIYLPHKAHKQIFFRYTLLMFPLVHMVFAVLIEVLISDSCWLKKLVQCIRCKRTSKNKYKKYLSNKDFVDQINRCSLDFFN